jgi:alkanesulfonate monooxygenase SsuD/methylene tetrahydromethanopterin reductase-like flavin-dependent oxidoreductase (luciferase family)
MSSALQATERVPFITAVTAPIMRYHPAIVAQAFATMGAMYPGRVGIGVGTGEPPNEMALRSGEFPSNATRLEMLEEAITIMNRLWTSTDPISFAGKYYTLNNAVVLTKPAEKIPVYVSAIGPRSAKLAGRLGDHLMSLATDAHHVKEVLMPTFEAGAREAGKDPNTMERTVQPNYIYDPEQVIHPEDFALIKDPGTVPGTENATVPGIENAVDVSLLYTLAHNAEDIITAIEKLKGMGYNHFAVANVTFSNAAWRQLIETARQSSALPTATLDRWSRATWDEAASLKVWEDVLPHIR